LSELFSSSARNIFGLSPATIAEGAEAELTIFSTQETTSLSKEHSKSKSANSPFWDITLKGKVIGTYVKGKILINK
jgi:dihydroorotase